MSRQRTVMNQRNRFDQRRRFIATAIICLVFIYNTNSARAGSPEGYRPADEGQHPAKAARLLPDSFLRGYDPITVYFSSDQARDRGPADDGARLLSIEPSWPGAFFWTDRRTLQFRPAEPWPALARFAIGAAGDRKILTTMMSAPSSMSPESGSTDLKPFRTITLKFPQALPLDSLRQMLRLELRELPGLADSPRKQLQEFSLAQLPRGSNRDAAVYAITLPDDVPEGRQLRVQASLAFGDTERTLWEGVASTRLPFHLESVRCGPNQFAVDGGGSTSKEMALACGNRGDLPQLAFSAPVADLTLTALGHLVRLEPAVADLAFDVYGARVQLRGKFLPDTLYRIHIGPAPIHDDSGRALRDPQDLTVFAYRGWKTPFVRFSQASATLEANGPRMLPLLGYGDARADLRIYRIDPLHNGLWPFPEGPVVIREESAPPFPGEEPKTQEIPGPLDREELSRHLRMLGTPIISRIVDLPLAQKGGATKFGLDLAPLLDPLGGPKAGTYLVGLRRLTGAPERSYVRVQITNLSLTTVEERERAVFFVRSIDKAEAVKNATITLEGQRLVSVDRSVYEPARVSVSTDSEGRAQVGRLEGWTQLRRISVRLGDDVLVIDPADAPTRLTSNHWADSKEWLSWLMQNPPPPLNDKLLAFVFPERPIYRPGEKVYLKGYIRQKEYGALKLPAGTFELQISGPSNQLYKFPLQLTANGAFALEFQEKDPATGDYTATVYQTEAGSTSFPIASRAFKIEAYRVPTFEVQLAAPATVRLDAPFQAKALARYYAGGNVAGQPISWQVTRRAYHHQPAGREGWLFASSSQFSREGQSKMPDAQSRSATLDEGGADSISVNPALDIDGSARIYRFEATVTGADGQPVTATTETKALPPFVLGMKLARYLESAAWISPQLIAVGVDDKPVSGQEIVVRLYKRIWHSNLRETHFATGEAKYVTEQEDVKLLEKTVVSDAAKAVVPELPIQDAGVYLVELVARDKLGRVQTLSADLYIGGRGAVAWQKSRDGAFEAVPDKRSYKPGETAKVVLQSPFQTGRALIIEEDPEGNRYSWHEIRAGKAVHEIRVREGLVPNLPVHIVLMRGRLGEGEKEDGRFRPETVAANLELEIEPVKNQIQVEVSHPEVAKPGTRADFTITLKDDSNRPLSGEVTLWLVDEAVLSLAKEGPLDPLSAFIDRNRSSDSIRDTRDRLVGKLFEQDEDEGGDGDGQGEGKSGSSQKRAVRRNFQTTPYYQSTLIVPPSGKLTVPIQLSDDLTNFKVRAVASSGSSRFGFHQSVIHLRLPLLVQPQLPRLVRQGDTFWGGGVARLLEGAEGKGTVNVEISGPVIGGKKKQSIDLHTNKAESVVFPLTAQSVNSAEASVVSVKVEVARDSDGQGDAFEVKIPVLPDRRLEHFAYIERYQPGPISLKPFPESPRPGTATEQVLVTAVPGILELAAGLEYLASYPHGCLEQKLSQVSPEISQGALLHAFGLEDGYGPHAMSGARKMIAELASYQDESGLFGYWPGTPGDLQLTANLIEFLERAKAAGLEVDAKIEARAETALQNSLRSNWGGISASYRFNQQTAALRALSNAGLLDEHYLIDLFHSKAAMDPSSLADLALAMSAKPSSYSQNLSELKFDLWNSVVLKLVNGQQRFDGIRQRRSGWGENYLGSNVSTVASVMEALLVLDPANPRQAQLRDGLVSYATAGNGFGTTFDNRRAIAALAKFLEEGKDPLPESKVVLSGQELLLDARHKAARASFQLDGPPAMQVSGAEVGARVSYTYLPALAGDQDPGMNRGLFISSSTSLVHTDGSMDAPSETTAGHIERIALGDVLEINAQLQTEDDKYFVALVVPFAAGLEPMNPALANSSSDAKPSQADSTTPTYVERLDGEVRYYFNQLPHGAHAFHFRVRAATEGSFVQPAPWGEQMYKPEVTGRGAGMRFVVTGEHQK